MIIEERRGPREGRIGRPVRPRAKSNAILLLSHPDEEAPGISVFYKDKDGNHLPHVFRLRSRHRDHYERVELS